MSSVGRRHFAADLHLGGDVAIAEAAASYFDALHGAAALYLLGDLFDAWVGDDQPIDGLDAALDALRRLASAGTRVFLFHGNRDFLIGPDFAARIGATLVREDVRRIAPGGQPTLLLHGDTLCTGDPDYQALRREMRDPAWQAMFLARPLHERLEVAGQLRGESRSRSAGKTPAMMDVETSALRDLLRRHRASTVIHGHVHRPREHRETIDGRTLQRLVLGDWHADGGMVGVWNDDGPRLLHSSAIGPAPA